MPGIQLNNLHIFSNNSAYFFYDIKNNRIIAVNNAKIFHKLKKALQNKITVKTKADLKNNKILDEYLYLKKMSEQKEKVFNTNDFLKKNPFTSKITLMVTQNCNLNCVYCYGGESGTYGQENKKFMTKEIAKKAIKLLIDRNKKSKHYEITFFGGEPLLKISLIKYVMKYCRDNYPDKNFIYNMTTNGTLINDEVIKIFKQNPISLLMSIDGPKEIHNYNIKLRSGAGSFNLIIKNIKLLKKNNIKFSIRSTLDDQFSHEYSNIAKYFLKLGANNIFISRTCDYDENSNLLKIDIEKDKKKAKYVNEYNNKVLDELLSGKKPKSVPFFSLLERIHNATKDLMGCGFLRGATAVSTDGSLYICHRFVGIDDFKFGDVNNGIDYNVIKSISKKLDNATNQCQQCFAKNICKRSCIRNIAYYDKFAPFNEDDCDLMKDMIEFYLYAYYKIKKERSGLLARFNPQNNKNRGNSYSEK